EATKLSNYITEGDKSYQVDIRLGVETDTLDITGQVISEKPVHSTESEIINMAMSLFGEMDLPIPIYSAKKIDGKKLYEYAREEIAVVIPTKKMKFWDVENKSHEKRISFQLACSKGSFIRSWVKLLGEELGCGATMSGLIRTSSHKQKLSDAIDLEALKTELNPERHLVSLDQALPEVKRIKVKGQDLNLLRNGQISHDLRSRLIIMFDPEKDQYIQVLNPEQKLLALIGVEPGKGLKIRRIFH
ncbi:MAG: tRNA pseudouridine(55) synthase TruB, partial [Bdellovibrionaceae bacterium]|nr:tRNA pseudouridine(55) synthase TruB [Pseudobdellovibrionaceae bacterium]